jgi:hypothetical protein
MKINNIRPKYGSRVACKIAARQCEAAYRGELAARVGLEWISLNQAMYANTYKSNYTAL